MPPCPSPFLGSNSLEVKNANYRCSERGICFATEGGIDRSCCSVLVRLLVALRSSHRPYLSPSVKCQSNPFRLRRMGSNRTLHKNKMPLSGHFVFAERVGFEPTVPFGTPVFKTGCFNRSHTSPNCQLAVDIAS